MLRPDPSLPVFSAPYAPDDAALAAPLLAQAPLNPEADARIDAMATRLIKAIRDSSGSVSGVEDMLREFSLSTREGLALMVLAEALLRVPDTVTADRLIEDKLAAGDWANAEAHSGALLVSASAWTLCAVATHSRAQESTSPATMRSTTAKTSPRSALPRVAAVRLRLS